MLHLGGHAAPEPTIGNASPLLFKVWRVWKNFTTLCLWYRYLDSILKGFFNLWRLNGARFLHYAFGNLSVIRLRIFLWALKHDKKHLQMLLYIKTKPVRNWSNSLRKELTKYCSCLIPLLFLEHGILQCLVLYQKTFWGFYRSSSCLTQLKTNRQGRRCVKIHVATSIVYSYCPLQGNVLPRKSCVALHCNHRSLCIFCYDQFSDAMNLPKWIFI